MNSDLSNKSEIIAANIDKWIDLFMQPKTNQHHTRRDSVLAKLFAGIRKNPEQVSRHEYSQTDKDSAYNCIDSSVYLPTRNIPVWYTGEEEPDTYCLKFVENTWPTALAKAAGGEREAIEFLELLIKTLLPKLSSFCPRTFASIFSKSIVGNDYIAKNTNTNVYPNGYNKRANNKITRGVFDEYDINAMYPYLIKVHVPWAGIDEAYELRQKVIPTLKPYVKLAMNTYASSRQHEFSAYRESLKMTALLYNNEPECVGIHVDSILLPVGSKPQSIPISDKIGHFKFVRQTPEITVFSASQGGSIPRRFILSGPYCCFEMPENLFLISGKGENGKPKVFIYQSFEKTDVPEDYQPESVDYLDKLVAEALIKDYAVCDEYYHVYIDGLCNLIPVVTENIRCLIDANYPFQTLIDKFKLFTAELVPDRVRQTLHEIYEYAHMIRKTS